jgi:predicted RNA-binding Zn-ribbon protein involved in translation (DUF1610 family)
VSERIIKRPRNVMLRTPKNRHYGKPVPHTSKKPTLVSTGVKIDRLCGICLGRLQPGVSLTFCECGKFFHMACISEVKECPVCHYQIEGVSSRVDAAVQNTLASSETDYGDDLTEVMYQCPVCDSYVPENATACKCGAVFDREEGQVEVFVCPGCGAEVRQDSDKCEKCGMEYESLNTQIN